MVYYNYRYYNPTDGRWLAVGPIISPNLYSYCNNVTIIGLDVLGLAFLNKHLATADLFISNYSNIDKDEESKECFRFGSLLPDIPFASIARNVTLHLMDESSILRGIFSGIGTILSWIVSPFSYLYDLLFGPDDDSYSSFDQNAENIIFHLSNISRIETLRSHFGDLASYHAMAMKGTETPESTFDNMVENIKKFILESHGSCHCSRFIANGKRL